jgi:hypothetical protein
MLDLFLLFLLLWTEDVCCLVRIFLVASSHERKPRKAKSCLQQSRTKPVALRHRRRVKAGMLFLPVERFERHWTRRSSEDLEDMMVVVKTRCSCGQIRSERLEGRAVFGAPLGPTSCAIVAFRFLRPSRWPSSVLCDRVSVVPLHNNKKETRTLRWCCRQRPDAVQAVRPCQRCGAFRCQSWPRARNRRRGTLAHPPS